MITQLPMLWANQAHASQVWLAALHDSILCESDRHEANLVVHEDATFRFIDNDHELNNRAVIGKAILAAKDTTCMPNSIFLPHNLESWRVCRLSPVYWCIDTMPDL